MVQRLFIINFKQLRTFIFVFLSVFILFFLDFTCYQFGYSYYDKLNHFNDIKKKSDIVIIGSSNVLWDIEPNQLKRLTGSEVKIFALAGGNIEYRFYLLKEYLALHKNNPPQLVIFHTDRFALNRKRYGDDAYKSLQGYYHQGILQEYLNYKWNDSIDSKFKKIFKSFSLNSESYFILSKLYDKTNSSLKKITSQLHANEKIFTTKIPKEHSKKIDEWKKLYEDPNEFIDYDQVFLNHFNRSIHLMKTYPNTKFILLETPMYNLFGGNTYFKNVRKLFKESESKNIKYLLIENEQYLNNEKLYFDASHLNTIGQIQYTMDLAKNIQEYLNKTQ